MFYVTEEPKGKFLYSYRQSCIAVYSLFNIYFALPQTVVFSKSNDQEGLIPEHKNLRSFSGSSRHASPVFRWVEEPRFRVCDRHAHVKDKKNS